MSDRQDDESQEGNGEVGKDKNTSVNSAKSGQQRCGLFLWKPVIDYNQAALFKCSMTFGKMWPHVFQQASDGGVMDQQNIKTDSSSNYQRTLWTNTHQNRDRIFHYICQNGSNFYSLDFSLTEKKVT